MYFRSNYVPLNQVPDVVNLTNGDILEITSINRALGQPFRVTHNYLCLIKDDFKNIPLSTAVSSVAALEQKVKLLKKSKSKHEEKERLLAGTFVLPSKKTRKENHEAVVVGNQDVVEHSNLVTVSQEMASELNTLKNKLDAAEKKIEMTVKVMEENKVLKQKIKELQPKRLNQTIKRKNEQIRKHKMIIKTMSKQCQNCEYLKKEFMRIKKQKKALLYYRRNKKTSKDLSVPKCFCKSELKGQQSRIQALEIENLELVDQISELKKQNSLVTVKEGNLYNSAIRKCVFNCLQNSVPVERVRNVISFTVKELTGIEIKEMPSVSSISRMSREMSVLSDIQSVEALSKHKNSTISWDATSIDGAHINEVHISTKPNEQYALNVSSLCGGRAGDYKTHITETLADISKTYSEVHDCDPLDNLGQCKSNISNTLSDRVAVNHCVNEMLSADFEKPLTELNCNVHPLDALAHKAQSVTNSLEKSMGIQGKLFGKDSACVNTLHAISKMRYKQSSGHPGSFKRYFKMNNLSLALIPRYVGNRMHVLFLLAESVFYLHEHLLEYLNKWCPVQNSLRSSLISDLGCPEIMIELQVLGLFGKMLTGPWMTAFYGNSKQAHMDVVPLMHQCMHSLNSVQQDPSLLWTCKENMFGSNLNLSDPVVVSLRNMEPRTTTNTLCQELCLGFKEVLSRQLSRYLSGEVSEEGTQSAPVHNMFAERILGN